MSTLSKKELDLLDQISRNSSISQRELAQATQISLGLVNVILKRFLRAGYLQVSRLNKRKLEYLLTPQGFLAVTRKTYTYASKTIRDFREIQTQITLLLTGLNEAGYDYFSIHGDGELRELIESLAPTLFNERDARLGSTHKMAPSSIVLNISTEREVPNYQGTVVNVIEKLNQSGTTDAN